MPSQKYNVKGKVRRKSNMKKEILEIMKLEAQKDDNDYSWYMYNKLEEHLDKVIKRNNEKIVTLYTLAIGDQELPENVWKKIADVNGILLN